MMECRSRKNKRWDNNLLSTRRTKNQFGALSQEPDFLFEKRYDALRVSPSRTGNFLNGTCQLGQLLSRGYDQELRNGRHLREAYFYDGNETGGGHAASDPRMRLWDLTRTTIPGDDGDDGDDEDDASIVIGDPTRKIYQEPNLRYRADDEQRTLMSGQVLLRGLFEPELLADSRRDDGDDGESAVVRLHTADYKLDVLHVNEDVCPRARELRMEAYGSDEYRRWIENSVEVKTVASFAGDVMGMEGGLPPDSILDCMMTTMCTDRTLPDELNDYDGSLGPTPYEDWVGGDSSPKDGGAYTTMFERVANVAVKNFTFPYRHNDAAYAKLGMGPLWKEIMANINPIIDPSNHPPSPGAPPPPKLALFSGHDTTLMPILATLGGDVWSGTDWAPYASMIQIEVHEMIENVDGGGNFPSGYAFRLVYNGEVLTSRMDGCDADLCDSRVLSRRVMPFAKYRERDCAARAAAVPPPGEGLVTEMKDATENLVAAPGGVWVIASLVVLSMLLGSAITCFLMKRMVRRMRGYMRDDDLALGDISMRVMDDYGTDGTTNGIDSAVSANYGSTNGHRDGKAVDENALI